MKDTLEIKNLEVWASGKKILKGINLKIRQGEIHLLMGPNGAGKTSLAYVLMGHPNYKPQISPRLERGDRLSSGAGVPAFKLKTHPPAGGSKLKINGKDITKLRPDERAKLGLFISFQKPISIPGVSVRNLLRLLVKEDFAEKISQTTAELKINEDLLTRPLNENFSGGEGKLMELFQAKILKPKFLILDEIDSGLDVDALRLVAKNIGQMVKKEDAPGVLLITHNPRILKFIKPDHIHVLRQGEIIRSDGLELGKEIERKGYQCLTKN